MCPLFLNWRTWCSATYIVFSSRSFPSALFGSFPANNSVNTTSTLLLSPVLDSLRIPRTNVCTRPVPQSAGCPKGVRHIQITYSPYASPTCMQTSKVFHERCSDRCVLQRAKAPSIFAALDRAHMLTWRYKSKHSVCNFTLTKQLVLSTVAEGMYETWARQPPWPKHSPPWISLHPLACLPRCLWPCLGGTLWLPARVKG